MENISPNDIEFLNVTVKLEDEEKPCGCDETGSGTFSRSSSGFPNVVIKHEEGEELYNQGFDDGANDAGKQPGFRDAALKPEKEEGLCNHGSEDSRSAALNQSDYPDIVIKMEEENGLCDRESEETASITWDQAVLPEIVVKLEEEERQEKAQTQECASVAADQSDKMSAKRKSYSVEYKKSVVEDSHGKNLAAYCREKKLDLRLFQKWRADYSHLSQQVAAGNAKKRKCGSGRQTLFPDLEGITCEWIADRRAKAVVVRRADIQAFALAMAPKLNISPGEFKASQHWLDNFLQRYEVPLRRSAPLFKLEDAEVVRRALAFKFLVDGTDFSQYRLCDMVAVDETAVLTGRGPRTTSPLSAGYEGARVCCVLALRLDGTKVSPLMVAKGPEEKMECVSGLDVLETDNAWCSQAVLRRWVDLVLPPALRGGRRGLLVWDSASTHRTKGMASFLAQRRIDQIVIPAGMTAYLQTLDIAIKKPFKDRLQVEINDFVERRREENQDGHVAEPGLQEVAAWVKNAWDAISDASVARALQAGYLDKMCPFKESFIARHERFGSMVLREMELQESQTRVQGLESYDDVPEDDDMTVFE